MEFQIEWQQLYFEAKLSPLQKLLERIQGHRHVSHSKTILNGISGRFSSAQLTGILGPSGSGKSTLLKCIYKRNFVGRTGNINVGIKTDSLLRSNLRLAFIPQQDNLFEQLTVKEAVHFAGKLHQETNKSTSFMDEGLSLDQLVDSILDILGLTACAANKIGLCSGGQQKRVSIAQELIRSPNVLILDEPTSGLDSLSCELLVKYLKKLTESSKSTAIVLTIHQPSYKVLCYFQSLYILSRNGLCIYHGPPQRMVSYFSKYDLHCPEFYNPADYALEVASGLYGPVSLQIIELALKKDSHTSKIMSKEFSWRQLTDLMKEPKHPLISHAMVIAGRSFITTLRNPWDVGIRFVIHFLMGLIVGLLYRNIGVLDGCPIRPNVKFDPADLEVIQNATKAQSSFIYDNCGGLVGLLLLNLYTTLIATAFTFPSEMSTLVKEQSNGWYKVISYFMGKSLADVPVQVACPLVSGIPSYILMGQSSDPFRLFGVISIQVLVSLISQSQGLLVGALFVSAAGAVYFAPMTMTPLFLFGGYVISKSSLPLIYQPMMYASYVYYGFQATLSFVYGFDRCGPDVAQKTLALHRSMTDWFAMSFGIELDSDDRNVTSFNETGTGISTKFVDSITNIVAGDYIRDDGKVKSLALITFQVFDEMYWIHILMLIALVLAMRVAAFLVIRFQIKRMQ